MNIPTSGFDEYDSLQQDNNPDKPRNQTTTERCRKSGWTIIDLSLFVGEDGKK